MRRSAPRRDAEPGLSRRPALAATFKTVFLAIAATLAASFLAVILLEEKPLDGNAAPGASVRRGPDIAAHPCAPAAVRGQFGPAAR